MKEHPIIFSAEMVNAILDGRKTETRRVIKPQPPHWTWNRVKFDDRCINISMPEDHDGYYVISPYGKPGDRLWVRETWVLYDPNDGEQYHKGPIPKEKPEGLGIAYRADNADDPGEGWRPSIFMPRWASRITLEIVDVRVERLQEIARDGAKAEGVSHIWRWDKARYSKHPEHFVRGVLNPYVANYSVLWDEINGKGAWDTNPWVWVIDFKMLEPFDAAGTCAEGHDLSG